MLAKPHMHKNEPTWVAGLPQRAKSAAELFVYVTALIVALAAAVGIGLLQYKANQHRTAQLTLAQIRCIAFELDEGVDRALTHSASIADTKRRTTTLQEQMQHLLLQLRSSGVDKSGVTRLTQRYHLYRKATDREFVLLKDGLTAAAQSQDTHETRILFSSYLDAVGSADSDCDKLASQSNLLADAGTIAAVMLSGILISLLFRRFARAQEQLAVKSMAAEQRVLRQSEERFRALVSSTNDIIAILQPNGEFSYLSPTGEKTWRRALDQPFAPKIQMVVHPDDRNRLDQMLELAAEPGSGNNREELRLLSAEDEYHFFEIVLVNRVSVKGIEGIVATCHDVTERKSLVDRLSHQAYHDALTGLPNRTHFMRRLDTAVKRAGRNNSMIALLIIDLDNFKVVNDSLGHQAGDKLLTLVSQRLRGSVRDADVIARLGGDEFTVLMEGMESHQEVLLTAERMHRHITQSASLSDREIVPNLSIGIVLSENGEDEPEDLMRYADTAMYQAKVAGKGQYLVFDKGMKQQAMDRLEMESELRLALERHELRVFYQPILSLETGEVVDLEALVRWQHPTRGLIAPAAFIPLAEETGLVVPLGEWVLLEACRQTRIWQKKYPDLEHLTISVNISGRQFGSAELADKVRGVLHKTQLAPGTLKLEITETEMMQDVPMTIKRLRDVRQLGVQLAIDDFGTGYSSMCYLSEFPLDTLKIDRAFVQRMDHSPEDQAIVEAIITLGRNLFLRVTAEGVETEHQLHALQAMGCDRGQGYLFSKPVDTAKMDEFLASRSALAQFAAKRTHPFEMLKAA